MTKKDYELIARAIQEIKIRPLELRTLAFIVRVFSSKLSLENPRFNSDLFAKACGLVSY